MRKVFLDDLPRQNGYNGKRIDWDECIGLEVKFIYDDIIGEVEILRYQKKGLLTIRYNNKYFKITSSNFMKCKLGGMLHESGDILCPGKGSVEGVNDIPTTNPEMIKYFQGGYNEAKLYTYQSNKKIQPICPICNTVSNKLIPICNLYNQNGFRCDCGDGFSVGHKIIHSILLQNNVSFISNARAKWCEFKNKYNNKMYKGEYDFLIENMKIIIEVDGEFHRNDNKMNGQTKEESQYIDSQKDILAKNNGFIVIRIPYNDKNIDEYISEILKSELKNIVNINNDIIIKALEFSSSSLSKIVATYWNNKRDEETTASVTTKFGINRTTVSKYLKYWTKIGYCNYNPNYEFDRRYEVAKDKNRVRDSKRVKVFNLDEELLTVCYSISDLERESEAIFGVVLQKSNIIKVLKGIRKHHKGFVFEYATDKEYEEYLKSQEFK